MSRMIPLLFVVLGASPLGCASEDVKGKQQQKGETVYSGTARRNYEKGLEELKDDNYPEAMGYFNRVRTQFPFSKYATLSELAIADLNFARERFTEAVDGYRTFARSHPTHEKVDTGYVAFKVGESYYKQVPDEWWITPPSHEMDQSPTIDALRELDSFLDRYAPSGMPVTKALVKTARKYRTECARMLALHELGVGRFYLSGITQTQPHPRAALWRARTALEKFGATGLEHEALLLMGEAYFDLKDLARAKEAFSQLATQYPKTPAGRRAKRLLARIESMPKTQPLLSPSGLPALPEPKKPEEKAAPSAPAPGTQPPPAPPPPAPPPPSRG